MSTLHLVLQTAPPRPIQQSHAKALTLITTAFEVIPKHRDADRLAEDFVEQFAMMALVWIEENLEDIQ